MFFGQVVYSKSKQNPSKRFTSVLGVVPDRCGVASALSCAPGTPSQSAAQYCDVLATQGCQRPIRNFPYLGYFLQKNDAVGNPDEAQPTCDAITITDDTLLDRDGSLRIDEQRTSHIFCSPDTLGL